ncbi:hypothetical protein EON65_49230 [archaeon]|nr:MAG: hypothetical protein EON65_49230 [archaeon]
MYSQYSIHQNYGGVVPGLAMEEHKKHINLAIQNALQNAGMKSMHEVDAIAVTQVRKLYIMHHIYNAAYTNHHIPYTKHHTSYTIHIHIDQGPGLEICLRVGVRQAQELARVYNKPLVCVHHLEVNLAHVCVYVQSTCSYVHAILCMRYLVWINEK